MLMLHNFILVQMISHVFFKTNCHQCPAIKKDHQMAAKPFQKKRIQTYTSHRQITMHVELVFYIFN